MNNNCIFIIIINRYTPRVVLVDTDSRTTDSIQSGFLGRLFNPDQFITDSSSTGIFLFLSLSLSLLLILLKEVRGHQDSTRQGMNWKRE